MTEFLNEALDDSYITPKGIIKIIKKVGISGASNVYQVECSECSKDKELWDGIVLTSDRFRLKHGYILVHVQNDMIGQKNNELF